MFYCVLNFKKQNIQFINDTVLPYIEILVQLIFADLEELYLLKTFGILSEVTIVVDPRRELGVIADSVVPSR